MYNNVERNERNFPLNMPKNWEPPYPTFTSNISPKGVSLQIIGCQYTDENQEIAEAFIKQSLAIVKQNAKSDSYDIAHCMDAHGLNQMILSIYWVDQNVCESWLSSPSFKDHWQKSCVSTSQLGIYREQFNVAIDRFETIQSGSDHVAGAAISRTDMIEEPIDLHGYWGAMRDRLPISAQDNLEAHSEYSLTKIAENHFIVKPNENVCMIRSGQDWTQAVGEERQEYLEDIAPILKKGMDFLRDEGAEVNCISNRFMHYLDNDTLKPKDHSFGLACFKSLADLEFWSKEHPTHLAIFGSFFKFAPKYGELMKSRFWHEVSVMEAKDVVAEYYNCQSNTGFMTGQ